VQAPDGIRLAPPLHRFGPLLGDVVLPEPLEGADELAVHEPGRERIEAPGDRRHPDFVEQRQAFLDIAVEDAQPRSRHASECARRGVAPRAHLDRAVRPAPGARDVAGQHPLVGADDREPRVRGRPVPALEQPLGPSEPAAHRRHQRRVEEQVHRDADRRVGRRDRVAGLDV
jgi:hypothetical protein